MATRVFGSDAYCTLSVMVELAVKLSLTAVIKRWCRWGAAWWEWPQQKVGTMIHGIVAIPE